ncbi:MAG: DUF1573 domain-containing protein [Planctomycetota bacterium]
MQKFLIGLALVGGLIAAAVLLSPAREESIADRLQQMKSDEKAIITQFRQPEKVSDLPVPSPTGPWPIAEAAELVFSFGRMPVRSTNSHSFTIQNTGEADLQLKAGTTTCKCTTFGFGADPKNAEKTAVVAPGKSVSLLMNWKSGDVADRAFRHGGEVHTNDPRNPLIKLAVEGAVEIPFEVMPQYFWDFGAVYQEPAQFAAGLGSRLHDAFQIQSVSSPSGLVQVMIQPMSPEELGRDHFASGYSLNATVSAEIPPGLFQEELEIVTSVQPEPIRITVRARKYGALRIQAIAGTTFNSDTMSLQLGSFKAAEGREARVLLIVDEKDMQEPFKVEVAEADPAFLKVELQPVGMPSGTVHRYILALRIPPGRPVVQKTETNPGRIRLSTNHPSGDGLSLGLLLYSN